ncbi:hypothetical protein GFK82_00132 [Candidatus Steffania adelgidicola]|nr:hypothetical protein GFK82_00132 [Candidatus Steffania adelgidicola]
MMLILRVVGDLKEHNHTGRDLWYLQVYWFITHDQWWILNKVFLYIFSRAKTN